MEIHIAKMIAICTSLQMWRLRESVHLFESYLNGIPDMSQVCDLSVMRLGQGQPQLCDDFVFPLQRGRNSAGA